MDTRRFAGIIGLIEGLLRRSCAKPSIVLCLSLVPSAALSSVVTLGPAEGAYRLGPKRGGKNRVEL